MTGFADTNAISQSVALLKAKALDYEFRTTVIPDLHSDATMHAMLPLLEGARRYTLQPFLPREDLPDPSMRALPRTPHGLLEQLAAIARPVVQTLTIRG
jgi:pyruvate formate lyase activating enzyme